MSTIPGETKPVQRADYSVDAVTYSPPWLRSGAGGKLMRAIGDVFNALKTRTADAIKIGHPIASLDPEALALIGEQRRILRGPSEDAATYASRLPGWWTAHQRRGGDYSLIEQLYLYWKTALGVKIDVISSSGKRLSVSTTGVITRDSITWTSPYGWARNWIIFHTGAYGPLTVAEEEEFRAIVRDWKAAHVISTIVLLTGELWDYPQPVGTWDSPVVTWDSTPNIELTLE